MSYEGEGLILSGQVACRFCGTVIDADLDDLGQPIRDLCRECEDWANGEDVWGCEE